MASDQLTILLSRVCLKSSRSFNIKPSNHPRIRTFSSTCAKSSTNTNMSKRNRRKLAMPEAPSFRTKEPLGPKSSHVVFNPPPSIPNVYHTPFIFLPRHDPRRKLYSNAPSLYNLPSTSPSDTGKLADSSQGLIATPIAKPGTSLHDLATTFPITMAPCIPDDAPLPPPIPGDWKVEKVLTQDDVKEINRLRNSDPKLWTVSKLKDKFQCSASIIGSIAKNEASHSRHLARLETIKSRWSEARAVARRDRERRKVLWLRDA